MFGRIMVPVDLTHADKLTRALEVAGSLARAEDATLIYAAVGASVPGALSHNPEEFSDRLGTFAKAQADNHGQPVEHLAVIAHDPAVELRDKLVEAATQCEADLIVMASHVPGLADHWLHGNAAHVAQHAPISVFVVR